MRFPKETRALIHEAGQNPVTVPWPAGEREPQKGRVYWLQNQEDAKEAERKAKARREHSPETCAEVLAGMHRRHYGTEPEGEKKKRRRAPATRPRAGDPRIMVIDAAILDKGWEAKVALYVDPDPVAHLRVKAKVPAGPNPFTGEHEPTQTEAEQMQPQPTWERRLEEEQALKLAHKASVSMSEAMKAEQKLLNQRRKGKRSKLAEEALQRARKRADLASAEVSV